MPTDEVATPTVKPSTLDFTNAVKYNSYCSYFATISNSTNPDISELLTDGD